MSKYVVDGTQLTGIADAIRSKTGGTAELEFPTEFISAIGSISPQIQPEIKTGVVFGATLSTYVGSLTFPPYPSSDQTRFVKPINPPSGKLWLIKDVTSFSVFGVSQTVSNFVFVQGVEDNFYSYAYIYSATGQSITITKPSGGTATLEMIANIYEV